MAQSHIEDPILLAHDSLDYRKLTELQQLPSAQGVSAVHCIVPSGPSVPICLLW